MIWATGKGTFAEHAHNESQRVRVRPYLSPIADAYAAADFALTRAGALTLAELCAWGIPGILVPLPTAAADHQTANARALVASGAARELPQRDLTVDRLDREVRSLLDDPRPSRRDGARRPRAWPARRGRDDRAARARTRAWRLVTRLSRAQVRSIIRASRFKGSTGCR